MRKRPVLSQQKPINIITVENIDIQSPVQMTGHLYAYDKVDLYAEVSGILQETNKRFKEGYQYKKGEVLIKIDDRVFKNNVLAQKSNFLNQLTVLIPDLSIDFPGSVSKWQDYLKAMTLEKPLLPLPEPASDKERYYIVSRNIYNLFYAIKSMEATLSKYTLRAPFNGVVTQSQINPGTLVRQGQKLGEFTNTDLYELEAAVVLFDANRLQVGQQVSLTTEDVGGRFKGSIHRINRVIDPNSMSVKVYIHTRDTRLRDGMFMQAVTPGKPILNAYALKKDLLVGRDQLFEVTRGKLRLRKVNIIGEKGGNIIVRGLPDGTRLLGEVWAEAAEGKELPSNNGGQSMLGGRHQGPGTGKLKHKIKSNQE
jgi:multidrug efflux pump subunit AcrA (membrane-fusion protein)